MKHNKIGISTLVLAMLLVGIALIPTINAQEEKDYSVTVEKALKHANTHMMYFIAADSDFKEWKGASIDPKPLELYDINGKKLFYEFSVYKNNNLIGKIKVCANKKLGQSVQSFVLNPKPFDETEATKKSIEIAKNEYPDGSIKSTRMVVYIYPSIGAMTLVKDKTTGDEHRIIVDVYTLEEVEDKPATETEPGVWSMYDQILKNGVDDNLEKWQKSDKLNNFLEIEATGMGIDISAPVTEEKATKLSGDISITSTTTAKTLNVPLYGQETSYYCAVASAQMIAAYYGVSHSQNYIYGVMGGTGGTVTNSQQLTYYKSSDGLHKTRSASTETGLTFSSAVSEINNNKPFKSAVYYDMSSGHARVCRGYTYTSDGIQYLKLNDPASGGNCLVESPGVENNRIYVRS